MACEHRRLCQSARILRFTFGDHQNGTQRLNHFTRCPEGAGRHVRRCIVRCVRHLCRPSLRASAKSAVRQVQTEGEGKHGIQVEQLALVKPSQEK